MWLPDYEDRLREWYDLRNTISDLSVTSALIQINDWWWQAPIINHGLVWHDWPRWPDPWQLLMGSGYCDLARALGMLYTVMMIQHKEIWDAALIRTAQHDFVTINNEKYILNYSPGNVNTPPVDCTVIDRVPGQVLLHKIG